MKSFVESKEYAEFLKVEHLVDEKRITSKRIAIRLVEQEKKANEETF
jgi:hypothetical protein